MGNARTKHEGWNDVVSTKFQEGEVAEKVAAIVVLVKTIDGEIGDVRHRICHGSPDSPYHRKGVQCVGNSIL